MIGHLDNEEFVKFFDVMNDANAAFAVAANSKDQVVLAFGKTLDMLQITIGALDKSSEWRAQYLQGIAGYAAHLADTQDYEKIKQLKKTAKLILKLLEK